MKKKLTIEGMTCRNCMLRVSEALKGVESVSSVDVSPEEGYAIVETECGDEVLVQVLGEAGYDVIKVEPCTV